MTLSDFTQWLYRGHRPNWIARLLNRAAASMASLGFTPKYLVTLEVPGRTTGKPTSLPVVIAVVAEQRYLVSMLGENVQWVRNARAAGGNVVLHAGTRENVHLDEVPAELRAPVLKAYLQRAPGARPHIQVDKDAALSDFQGIAAEYPVFKIRAR